MHRGAAALAAALAPLRATCPVPLLQPEVQGAALCQLGDAVTPFLACAPSACLPLKFAPHLVPPSLPSAAARTTRSCAAPPGLQMRRSSGTAWRRTSPTGPRSPASSPTRCPSRRAASTWRSTPPTCRWWAAGWGGEGRGGAAGGRSCVGARSTGRAYGAGSLCHALTCRCSPACPSTAPMALLPQVVELPNWPGRVWQLVVDTSKVGGVCLHVGTCRVWFGVG